MHDPIKAIRCKYRIERGGITDVALYQFSPASKFTMAKQKAVENDAIVPQFGERLGTMAADIAGPAGD
jgi:hypothetical protein